MLLVRDAKPNASHYGLAALHHSGHVKKLITQNVDGLHGRAGFPTDALLELHGTLFVSSHVFKRFADIDTVELNRDLIRPTECSMSKETQHRSG